ncbi:uncharacterized protein IWZ02DRAFT_452370 [Phyllosticta citriasiana]|uniref:uncharacterized protein n=1 Tax=Phyllosticta citriasiana TaxID=595635 RepID=UPI0030FD8A26
MWLAWGTNGIMAGLSVTFCFKKTQPSQADAIWTISHRIGAFKPSPDLTVSVHVQSLFSLAPSSPAQHHHHHHRRNNHPSRKTKSALILASSSVHHCAAQHSPVAPVAPVAQSNVRTARYRRDGYAPANERQVVSESRRLLSDRRPAAGPSSPSYTTDGLTLCARHAGVVDSTAIPSSLSVSAAPPARVPARHPAFCFHVHFLTTTTTTTTIIIIIIIIMPSSHCSTSTATH